MISAKTKIFTKICNSHKCFAQKKSSFIEKRLIFTNPLNTGKELLTEGDPSKVTEIMFDDNTTQTFANTMKTIAAGEYQPIQKTKELIGSVRNGVAKACSETKGIGVDVFRTAIGEKAPLDTIGRALEGAKDLSIGTIKSGVRASAIAIASPFAAARLGVALTAGIASRVLLTAQEGIQIAVGSPSRPVEKIENSISGTVEKTLEAPSNVIKGRFGKARDNLKKWSGEGSEDLKKAA